MPKEIDGITYYTQDEVYKTSDEVNQIVQDRLARDRQERPGKPADYDQIKSEYAELTSKVNTFDAQIQQARDEAMQEATSSLAPSLVKERIRAQAAQKRFRDPDDALAQYGDVSDLWSDGQVNTDAIDARLAEISTSKPYLLSTEEPTPPAGQAGIGVGGAAAPQPKVEPGVGRLAAAYSTPQ